MSYTMFGERYFATRERLAGVMRGIVDLAADTGTDLGDKLPLAEIESGLGAPFLFVVCGEVNAGKSCLLNGLFGQDLCRVNVLPETDRVLWYKYGATARDAPATPLLEERFRPSDVLRDFHVIDTPGTNSAVEGHQQITARFLPSADLILFVFPVSNPWGAATWNFISELSAEDLERVVLIIQQADQRESVDLDVIRGHMTDLAMKRIGRTPPIFAVSAKNACEAKRATPFARAQFQKSGFPELENHISRKICESPARKSVLHSWRGQAASALHAVEDHIDNLSHSLKTQGRFLDTTEREIDDIRERFVVRLPTHLNGVAEVFETEAVWVSKVLHRRLAAAPSFVRLFIGDRTGQKMETLFIERLQTAVEAVAEKDGVEVVEFCHHHWQELGARVREAMGIDLRSSLPIDETLGTAKNRFILRLGRAARQGIGNLKVRNQLDKDIRRRNIALKSFTFMTLLLTTIGASCGALGLPWIPGILCTLAGLFLIGGVLTAWVTRKSITAEFQQRLLDTCGGFASTLRSDYEEALRIVFQDYASSLTAVHTHLAREKLTIEPKLKRWQELFLTLKAIEQEL
ncbi:dynamin family protein [Luteolibacter yonseiensis]|uniref:Dynamin family protein n=1 Tax=Luteolibacter yonseiensis TaxID=1144680 RepID=A0A934R8Y9_9BACT|nr:dynamin family protein [Luteolibacter yonseiensis]MBK1817249.1 dynamin family protein [Luteolibacter yonseiensis]